jgi:tetratricopeptide (TPR) repeat protein
MSLEVRMVRAKTSAGLVSVACLLGMLAGCARTRASAEFGKGNRAYLAEDFPRAIGHYRKAVELAPDMAEAHFYLANAHHALAGELAAGPEGGDESAAAADRRAAQVRENLEAAVERYEASAAANRATTPALQRVKRDTLRCLARIFSREPLRDETKALESVRALEPMLADDVPSALLVAEILRDSGRAADAEERLRQAYQQHPEDPVACRAVAAALGAPDIAASPRFDEAIALYETCAGLNPADAAGPRFLAMAYWSKGYRDVMLEDSQRLAYADKGLAALETALSIEPGQFEAWVYKGLLLRLKAGSVRDPRLARSLIEEADAARDRSLELRRQAAFEAAQR